jgi:hypothetical protein
MRQALLAAAVAVGLLVLFVGGSVFYLSWSACLGGERAALKEFPHYADPQSGPSPLQGTCRVRYTTEASRKEVLGYYDERLRKNDWEVLGFHTPYLPKGMKETQATGKRLSDLWELPQSAGGALVAYRDGYRYWVEYLPPSKEDPDVPDDKALVTASVGEGGRPGGFRD